MVSPQAVIVGHFVVPGTFDIQVVDRYDVADGIVALELEMPDGRDFPNWSPGAHIDVLLDGMVRQYSLCGETSNRRRWRIAILLEEAGRGGSAFIHRHVHRGSVITVSEPRNHFELVHAAEYIFIAGGIGITPILSMIRAVHARGADWTLHYGGRTGPSMAFANELTETFSGRVQLRPQDEVGLLDLTAILGQPRANTAVYCCGPSPLIAAVEEHCTVWPKAALHVERFQPKEQPAGKQDNGFQVELRRSGQVVDVAAYESLLDAVRNVGIPVASSCEEGACGTCEVAVLEGDVDHRDSILSGDEQAANDTMFICVSRARCSRLVLDL